MNREEQKLQIECVRWLRNNAAPEVLFTCTPANEVNAWRGSQNKAMGLCKGWADLTVMFKGPARPTVGFVEFKSEKGSLSEAQKEFGRKALEMGHHYVTVRSFNQFVDLMRFWGLPLTPHERLTSEEAKSLFGF